MSTCLCQCRGRALLFVAALLVVVVFASSASGQSPEPTPPLTPEQQKAADMRLPDLDRSALRPDRRGEIVVPDGERNPFGLVAAPPAEEEEQQVLEETEEMKIRRILGNMRVSGLSGAPGAYTALLGNLVLRQGEKLPRLFRDQGEAVIVHSITDREVLLAFEEKNPELPPRFVGIAVSLAPSVESLLAGETFRKVVTFDPKGRVTLPPLALPSVKAVVDGIEATKAQGLYDRGYELMADPAPPMRNEKDKDETE